MRAVCSANQFVCIPSILGFLSGTAWGRSTHVPDAFALVCGALITNGMAGFGDEFVEHSEESVRRL